MSTTYTQTPPVPRDQLKHRAVYISIHGPAGQPMGHGSGIITNLRTLGFDQPLEVEITPGQMQTIELDYPLIVTCSHVVHTAPIVMVETYDGDSTRAMVLPIDPEADIALILPLGVKDVASFNKPAIPASSNLVKQGDDVFAIGTPLGPEFKFKLTRGIISATSRPSPIDQHNRAMTYLRSFEIDAGIKPGNSGGPLFNRDGHWIGMNYAGLMTLAKNDMGHNYSLHVDDIILIMKRMLKAGGTIRPGLQIGVRPLMMHDSASCNFLNGQVPRMDGAFISYVKPGSPSEKIFKHKDIILQVNGDIIKSVSDFRYAIYKAAGKDAPVKFRIWRDGAETTFDLNVPQVIVPFSHMAQLDFLGMHVINSFIDEGITITTISQGPASEVGLLPGTVITGIEDPSNLASFIKVHDVKDFYNIIIHGHIASGRNHFYIQYTIAGRTDIVAIVIPPQVANKLAQMYLKPPTP